jgi:integrase/recombinase XerD
VTPLRQRMLEELQRRNYSIDTIRGYILAVEQFARYFRKSPELMGAEEIGQFQLHLLREKKLAVGTIALRMGALRFLYKKTLKRRDLDFDDLPLLKKPKKLPVVLSPEEVARLIEAAPNLLYRTLLIVSSRSSAFVRRAASGRDLA